MLDRLALLDGGSCIDPSSPSSPSRADSETVEGLALDDEHVRSLGAAVARERTREALFGGLEQGQKIHRYSVLERVGAGAMGVVYAAYDADLDRRVALKLLRTPEGASSSQSRERMLAEARALAKLSHPNVVTVFEVGVWGDGEDAVFLAMEFVRGRTLRAWREETQPDWRAVVTAYAQAGRGLAAVHRAGLVHRDFKPDNAMIDDEGRVRVMDFGLARNESGVPDSRSTISVETSGDSKLTRTGAIVGTPAYMAPEHFAGLPADTRSDQWAFCVALYEALWGRRPYQGETMAALAAAVLSGELPPEPTTNASVPRRIRAAVMRGLAAEPEARWPSLDALVDALEDRGRGRSRVIGVAAIATTLVVGVAAYGSAGAPEPCKGSEAAFAGAWNEAEAAKLRTAFVATTMGWAERSAADAQRKLDAYATGWIAEHRDACEAARVEHTQSDAMLDRRMRCLEHRRRDFVALVHALADIDAEGLARADAATASLVPPQRCGDTAFLDAVAESPPPPEVADMVENLRTQLAELDAAYDLGRARRVLPRTVGLVDAAAATAYAPVIAQAGLVVGKIQLELDQVESARGHLEDAYFTARGIADRSTASGAALYLASLTGTYTDEHVLARHWLRLAEVELDADAFDERAELADVEVSVLEREGRLDDAVATAERLLARLETECDEGCETKPATHGSLSRLYSHLGREREAERHARTQLELESALHEGDHPHRARALNTLGEVLDSTARFTESYEVLVVALQMRERMLGADHPETAITRLRLGTTLLALGRGDEAVQQAARAVEAVRTRPEPLLLAALLSELGGIHLDLKHYDEARAAYQESLEIGQRVNPGGDPNQAITMSNLAKTTGHLGDAAAALEGYRAALAMRREHVTGHDPVQSVFLINIGRALMDLGREEEAVAPLREGIALARDEEISSGVVGAQIWLGEALRGSDPQGAAVVLADARARCEAAPVDVRTVAGCERLE